LSRILISSRVFPSLPEPMARLEEEKFQIVDNPYFGQTLSEEQLLEIIDVVDGAIVGDDYFTRKVIEKGKNLKVIAKFGVGVDRVDLAAATEKGIVVSNAPGTNKHAVADMAIGLMLAIARKIPQAHNKVINEGFWKVITGSELWEKKLGILGLGQIGKEVARRASGFNMQILAYEPFPDMEFVNKFSIKLLSMEEVLGQSDFISLNLPSLPSTKGIINKETLALIKEGAYFINTARGDIVDDNALYEALVSGKLKGAALDVLGVEPPSRNHPLFSLDNVIITPHIGAHTRESQLRTGMIAVENVIRVLKGKEPLYQVN
jgi:D-3-phosphoglycerate dehydrogenase